jgi:hypothetical protein
VDGNPLSFRMSCHLFSRMERDDKYMIDFRLTAGYKLIITKFLLLIYDHMPGFFCFYLDNKNLS